MSFWQTDSRTPYGQKSISIVAENGKQFSPNSKITIVVSPDVAFFQPSESYLSLRVRVDGPTGAGKQTKLQLDSILGGQCLIKTMRILTGTGILIEEIQDYNILANIIYSYDSDRNIRNKRSLTEGTTIHNPECAVTENDVGEDNYNSSNHNPYFSSPDNGASEQQWVKLQLPIHTGIFRNKKIFPVVMTKGLRVEIMLEDSKYCVHNLETSYKALRCPRIFGSDKDTAGLTKAAKITTIALSNKNNVTSVETCPFKVGETIHIANGGTNEEVGVITSMTMTSDNAKVLLGFAEHTLANAYTTETSLIYSTSVSSNNDFKGTYTVDDVELVLQKIEVPPNKVNDMMAAMKEQGVMSYEFLSFQNYKRSLQSGIRQSTITLDLPNSQIKSILSVATDTAPFANPNEYVSHHLQHGLVGIADNITNYQWMYGGVLNPDRQVPMAKINNNQIEQQHLVELEKSLVVAGIPTKSFRRYKHQVVIGRAMALQQGSYDGRGKDFNLQIAYEETAAPAKNKLWNNFVCHVRTIQITANGIAIQS